MGAEITNQTRLEPQRHYSGPEFFREGFRPLFFLAGLWAALSVPLWIGIWSGAISYPGLGGATLWHVHEMMFGYVGAALGGFILTAVPNWTGRPPVRGWPLGALALIWHKFVGAVGQLSGDEHYQDSGQRFEVIRERAPQASAQQGFAWRIVTSAERPSVSSGDPLRQSMCDDMHEQPRSSKHDQQDLVGHCFFPFRPMNRKLSRTMYRIAGSPSESGTEPRSPHPPRFPPPWPRSRACHFRPCTRARPRRGSESCSLALVPAARKGPSPILSPARQDLAEAARLLGYFHGCGPAQDQRAGLSVLRF